MKRRDYNSKDASLRLANFNKELRNLGNADLLSKADFLEREKDFKDLQDKVLNPAPTNIVQLTPATMEGLEYFGVVLPGSEKDADVDRKQYKDILMMRYKSQFNKKKEFLYNNDRNANLTPLQKLRHKQSEIKKHGI